MPDNSERTWKTTRTGVRGVAFALAALLAGAGFVACQPPPPTCFGSPATIVGSSGNDTLTGTSAKDVIVGREGNDTIVGLEGEDVLCGGPGVDRLEGGEDKDLGPLGG